ncbi:MAG: oligosaccharide flippase family protein [Gemmatimonadota bacterium]
MRTTAETDTNDLARGAGVNYLGFATRIAPRALFLFLAGTLYGEARFGVFTFGITLVETAAALALFGMKRSLFKFMSEGRAKGESELPAVAHGIALALTTGTIVTLAVAAGAYALADLFRLPSAGPALLILTPAIPLIILSDILLIAIRFTRQMRFEVLARSVAEPITLAAATAAAYALGARDHGLILAYVTSLVVAAGLSVLFFLRVFPAWRCLRIPLRRHAMRRLVSFSGPTFGYELMALATDKVDIFLVTYFSPAAVVGIYGMARQLSTITKKIRQGFDRILPPVLSDCIASGDMVRARDQLAMVARWILTVQVLILVAFVFYAEAILGLFGSGFAGGAGILLLLLASDAVNGSLGVSELPIVYLKPGVNLWIGAGMLALVVGMGIWLTGSLGAPGAALSVLIAYSLANAVRIAAVRGLFHFTTVKPGILKPVVAGLTAFGAMLVWRGVSGALPPIRDVLGIPVLLASYLGMLYVLGLEPEDRQQLRRLRRRP